MKWTFVLASLLLAGLSGCIDDTDITAPGPVPSFDSVLPASAVGIESVTRLLDGEGSPAQSAGGIWPYGDYVFGSGLGWGMWIADISDPQEPVLLFNTSSDHVTSFARDADVVEHPDGRLSLVLATQNDGMHIWDVTDPAAPEYLARTVYEDDAGNPIPNHNIAVVPGTELVFNARSGGEDSTNDLVDVSDPSAPIVVGAYGTHGCHDIAFHGSLDSEKFRAYCAGIDRTEIWGLDGFDPTAPDFGIELITVIDPDDYPQMIPGNTILNTVGYPVRTLHHLAMANNDATVLIIGDEHNGGGAPGMCLAYNEQTGISTPMGALWFFDISDETEPTLNSWISPPTEMRDEPTVDPENTNPVNPGGVLNNLPSCTAHFGTVVPGEEKLVMSWYNAGVLLIDFTDIDAPMILDQWTAEDELVWDARIHHGYVITGDISRGMDILQLV